MRYPVTIEGMEGKKIEFQPPSLLTSGKLFVDDTEIKPSWGKFKLMNNAGNEVIVQMKQSFYDTASLVVNNKEIRVVEPLKWYEYMLSALPAFNVCIGGFIGALLGIIAIAVNIQIFRSKQSNPLKIGLVIAIDVTATIAVVIIAFVIAYLSASQ